MADSRKCVWWEHNVSNYMLLTCILFFGAGLLLEVLQENPNPWQVAGCSAFTAIAGFFLARNMFTDKAEGLHTLYQVTLTENGLIRSYHPKKKLGEVQVDDIVEVGILTTEDGPYAPDVWLMLLDRNGLACTFPSDADGHKPVIDHLLKFKGFDHRTFIEAMGSTSNAKFVVWQKKSTV